MSDIVGSSHLPRSSFAHPRKGGTRERTRTQTHRIPVHVRVLFGTGTLAGTGTDWMSLLDRWDVSSVSGYSRRPSPR